MFVGVKPGADRAPCRPRPARVLTAVPDGGGRTKSGFKDGADEGIGQISAFCLRAPVAVGDRVPVRDREHAGALHLRAHTRARAAARGRHVAQAGQRVVRYESVITAMIGAMLRHGPRRVLRRDPLPATGQRGLRALVPGRDTGDPAGTRRHLPACWLRSPLRDALRSSTCSKRSRTNRAGQAPPRSMLRARQPAGSLHHGVEHRLGEPAGERVLLARVVAAEQRRAAVERVASAPWPKRGRGARTERRAAAAPRPRRRRRGRRPPGRAGSSASSRAR